MRRSIRILALAAALALSAAACAETKDTGFPPADATPTQDDHGNGNGNGNGDHGGTESPPPSGPVTVEVVDIDYEPAEVTVAVGQEIVFVQEGSQPHSATAADGRFDSSPGCASDFSKCMQQGDEFTWTADKPGELIFYCQIHGTAQGGGQAGTITITAS